MSVSVEDCLYYLKNLNNITKEIKFYRCEQDIVGYFNLGDIPEGKTYKEALNNRLNVLFKLKNTVIECIQNIENPVYRNILTYYYILDWSIVKISSELAYSDRNIWYLHKKAVEELCDLLDAAQIQEVAATYKTPRYKIKCGICGKSYKAQNIRRSDKSPNGQVCKYCKQLI